LFKKGPLVIDKMMKIARKGKKIPAVRHEPKSRDVALNNVERDGDAGGPTVGLSVDRSVIDFPLRF
jgi:hypothetical protein